jgi:hypothetical protein
MFQRIRLNLLRKFKDNQIFLWQLNKRDFSMAAQQELARQAGLGAITFDAQGGVKSVGAGTGVMGFEPYLNQAAQYSGPDAYQQFMSGFEPYLQQAAQYSGPQAYQQFMSPYQQDVIDTTLTEYDVQSQRGMQGIADRAVSSGAFGGGREGVERANYQTDSNRNRAALQAHKRQLVKRLVNNHNLQLYNLH